MFCGFRVESDEGRALMWIIFGSGVGARDGGDVATPFPINCTENGVNPNWEISIFILLIAVSIRSGEKSISMLTSPFPGTIPSQESVR